MDLKTPLSSQTEELKTKNPISNNSCANINTLLNGENKLNVIIR